MNDKVLEADDAGLVEADDWAALEPKPAPLDASAELERQVAEFLAHGGHIKEFEPGESALPDNRSLWAFPVGSKSTPDAKKQAQGEARRRAIAVIRDGQEADSVLVAKMNLLLGTVKTGKELSEKMGVSPSVIYRLCSSYFPEDKRADRFRKRTVEERAAVYDAIMLPKIREAVAAGMKGLNNIAKHCGTSYSYITAANKAHKLNVPKEPAGRRVNREPSGEPVVTKKYEGTIACISGSCNAKYTGNCFYCPTCGHITAKGQARGFEE